MTQHGHYLRSDFQPASPFPINKSGLEPRRVQLHGAPGDAGDHVGLKNLCRKYLLMGSPLSTSHYTQAGAVWHLNSWKNCFQSLSVLPLALQGCWVAARHLRSDASYHLHMQTSALQPNCPRGQTIRSAHPLGLSVTAFDP